MKPWLAFRTPRMAVSALYGSELLLWMCHIEYKSFRPVTLAGARHRHDTRS